MTILIPIAEEIVFRSGVYSFFKSKIGIRMAMLCSSLIFMLIHANLQAAQALTVLALEFCYAYLKTDNIKVPIFMHIFNNTVAMGFIFIA